MHVINDTITVVYWQTKHLAKMIEKIISMKYWMTYQTKKRKYIYLYKKMYIFNKRIYNMSNVNKLNSQILKMTKNFGSTLTVTNNYEQIMRIYYHHKI